jgi:hypothetical protein
MAGILKSLWELAVRNRTLANTTALDVSIVDGNGNQVTSFGGGSGGTSNTDQSAFTVGSGFGTPAMGLFESSPTNVTDGKVGVLGMTTDRKLKISGSFSSAPITSATSTITNTPDNASSVTVLASNSGRLAFSLYNDSTSACYVKCGATASATSFIKKMLPRETWSTANLGVNWTGIIDAIWETAPGGAMRATELTA